MGAPVPNMCRCCAGSPEGDTSAITLYVHPTEDYGFNFMAVTPEYPHCVGYGKTAESARGILIGDINLCERMAALRTGRPFYPEMA